MPLPLDLTSSAAGCSHVRQHHPGAVDRMLPCAWPGCEVGVGEEQLSIEQPWMVSRLLLERRSLFLDGVEQVFFWHPCPRQR